MPSAPPTPPPVPGAAVRWVPWLLFLSTLLLFSPVRHHGFLNYDDPHYVTESPLVLPGLTWETMRRALVEPHFFMWHPLTTWSHQLDVTWFGLEPGAHHLVNVLLHAASAVLLCGLVHRATGRFWAAAAVAALFAWHPLRVESVAWAAERKDTLCTLFWLLTLQAYLRYVHRPGRGSHALVVATFALGILTKPMIVTLPCVLLLLDFWPLNRVPSRALASWAEFRAALPALWPLVREKLPLFALSGLLAALTWWAQSSGEVIQSASRFPAGERLANAVVAYARYLGKVVWPTDLIVFYPHPGSWPAGTVVGALLVVGGLTLAAWHHRERRPWLLVGWLWFLGVLFPISGIVAQSGGQSMADRYTYVSTIGLLLALVWSAGEARTRWRFPAREVALLVLCLLALRTHRQLGHWRDSETLFRHVLAVSPENEVGFHNLGGELVAQGRFAEAVALLERSVQLHPNSVLTRNTLGLALNGLERHPEALAHFNHALAVNPAHVAARSNRANTLRLLGRPAEAAREFARLLAEQPADGQAHNNYALALEDLDQLALAAEHYGRAIALTPANAEARLNLGILLMGRREYLPAAALFTEAVRLQPALLQARVALFYALAETGQKAAARQTAVEAMELARRQNRPQFVAELGAGLERYQLSAP